MHTRTYILLSELDRAESKDYEKLLEKCGDEIRKLSMEVDKLKDEVEDWMERCIETENDFFNYYDNRG